MGFYTEQDMLTSMRRRGILHTRDGSMYQNQKDSLRVVWWQVQINIFINPVFKVPARLGAAAAWCLASAVPDIARKRGLGICFGHQDSGDMPRFGVATPGMRGTAAGTSASGRWHGGNAAASSQCRSYVPTLDDLRGRSC